VVVDRGQIYLCLGKLFQMKDPIRWVVIGLACCIIISLFTFSAAFNAVVTGIRARAWVSVPASVGVVEERTDFGGRGINRYWHVEYRYRINQESFVSDKIAFLGFVPSRFQTVISQWSVGQTVTAYVNPQKPAQSVLWRQIHGGVYAVMVVSVAVAITLSCFLYRLRRNNKMTESVRELFRRQ
jgi:hypothetical protein